MAILRFKGNVQRKLIMSIVLYTVKKVSNFPFPSRVWSVTSRPDGDGKIANLFFTVYCPSWFRSSWKAFFLRRLRVTNLKGEFCTKNNLLVFQERVNSFPPPAARSPPVSVTEFQPPYFPPPFSTASMALQQAKQLSTCIGQKRYSS